MRRLITVLSLITLMCIGSNVNAQQIKLGHINFQELFQVMPERAVAAKEVQAKLAEYQQSIKELQAEYQKKLQDYSKGIQNKTLSDLVRKDKENELRGLETRINDFTKTADSKMKELNERLMKPIVDKANKAIQEVAKAQGLVYVFDSNVLLYKSAQAIDILPLVKTKLGIK